MAGKVNKGQWWMLGMAGASGGTTSQAPAGPTEEKLFIWKWRRIGTNAGGGEVVSYTVGYNGGGDPSEHDLSAEKIFTVEAKADEYIEEIKGSSSKVEWIVVKKGY